MSTETIQGFALSPQQKRLWSLGRHDDDQLYRAQCLVLIKGQLESARLRAAVAQVVQRHEILRTSFCCLHSMTVSLQIVNEDADFQFTFHEWQEFSADEQAACVENLWREVQQASLDVEGDRQLRVWLIALGEEEHLLLIGLPALCADVAGLRNLVSEISRYYDATINDEALDDEPMQYADISEWQTQLLDAADREPGRTYWTRQDISSVNTTLRLPFGRKLGSCFDPQLISLTLDPDRVQQLEALASRYESSVAVVLLTCWQILIGRLAEQAATVIGTGLNGRKYKELEPTLGLLTRFVPIKGQLDQELDFVHVLREQQASWHKANVWQENFTWENPTDTYESNAEEPFFPICYEYEEEAESYCAGGVKFSIVNEYACTERYEVKLSCRRSAGGMKLEFHYDANCYDEADMQRLAAQYQRLLQSVVRNEQALITELEVVSEPEREQQLVIWNETEVAYEAAASIVELFERQAAARPEAIAVVCGKEALSYAELNERANQLGHYLRRVGVGPEVLVGLCVERSLAMVVGVLGILKAGGAYVPLDASYPAARLEQMLSDSGAAVLLRQGSMKASLATVTVKEIWIEQEWEEIARESVADVKAAVAGENLAYVIYTSGSTGRPKGVGVTQQNLLHTTLAREHYYGRGEGRFLLLSSIAFDSSVAGLFWTLCGGGRLVIPEEGMQREPRGLVQLVQQQEVTHLLSLPSLYELLLEAGKAGELASLEGVIVAGEACGAGLVQRHVEVAAQAALYNEYGPTEGSVWSTVQQCVAESLVPIGRPIANVRMYVLDERMRVLPLGVGGEMYVGGAGVTRGYLNDAAQTAQKFVPDPFSGERGGRLYRTGDVGRYRRTGELEFAGRLDGQVKIRGYRVEVGEVETVLGEHERVAGAVVIVRESERGEPQLVGYVVARGGAEVSGAELRQWLGERLPEYMVPWRVMVLAEWPLQPNGKVDRQRLPEVEAVASEGERREASTPVEAVVQSIWEEVLGVRELSVTANFFELGGHSLLATQVMSRVREAFQVELPVRSLFAQPTVRGLAAEIEAQLQAVEGVSLPPIKAGGREGELPLSYAQQRLWFADQLMPGSALYNVAAAVRLSGELNVGALERTLSEVVRRHEVLRTSFPARQGEPVQVIAPASDFTLDVTDLTHFEIAERETESYRLAIEEARKPFDLSCGPLLRISLLRLGETEHIVLLTMHHIVSDEWSKGLLIREVAALYDSYSTGAESSLAELEIQYADYALWQRECLTGEVLEKQLTYWRQQLTGAPEALTLPATRKRSIAQGYRAGTYPVAFTHELSEQLKSLSRRESATLFMTLLTAFKILLHYYAKQDDIVVGANVANRNRAETEGLIGFFVNTVVLRTNLSGDPGFIELLTRVREVCLGAYTHQDMPFEKVVALLQPERNLDRQPLFQVKIDVDDELTQALELRGLTLSSLELPNDVGRYDLHLMLRHKEEGLLGEIVYDKNLFDDATVSMLSSQLENLLQQIVKQPDMRLSALEDVLAQADKQYQAGRETDYKNSVQQKFKQARQRLATNAS